MKNELRKLSTLLALILLFSFCPKSIVSAENVNSLAQADALKSASLFLGTGSGYDLGGILNRIQGITLALRAQGLEGAVQALSAVDTAVTLGRVADASQIPDWARKYVAFALRQNPAITTGVSILADGRVMFAPSQVMSGKEFITFMGRAMGYQISSLSSGLDTALSSKMLSASQIVSYANISSLTRGQAELHLGIMPVLRHQRLPLHH